jgi:hypothetical protein
VESSVKNSENKLTKSSIKNQVTIAFRDSDGNVKKVTTDNGKTLRQVLMQCTSSDSLESALFGPGNLVEIRYPMPKQILDQSSPSLAR